MVLDRMVDTVMQRVTVAMVVEQAMVVSVKTLLMERIHRTKAIANVTVYQQKQV
jgi:hypothetical protein